jgi:hypothetical protein
MSMVFETRISRLLGAGGYIFWALFGTICLAAGAMLIVALLKF